MVLNSMRVSLICFLLLVERWNLLLYALANPYHHEYGKYEDGPPVYHSSHSELHNTTGYTEPDPELESHQPSLAGNQQSSTKGFDRVQFGVIPSNNKMELPQSYQNPVSSSTGLYVPAASPHHTPRSPESAQIALVSPGRKRISQDSSEATNDIYTHEGFELARIRSAAGGFTQNAPGSLYPSNPFQNRVFVHTVNTVPYFSINANDRVYKRLENNLLAQEPTHFTEPQRPYPNDPVPRSQSSAGIQENVRSVTFDSSLQDSNTDDTHVTRTFPKTGYYERASTKITQGSDDQVNGKWALQRLVSSNSVPVQSFWSHGRQKPNNKRFYLSQSPQVQPDEGKPAISYVPQENQVTNKHVFSPPAKIRPAPHMNATGQSSAPDSLANWETTADGQVPELLPSKKDTPPQNSPEPSVGVNLRLAKNGGAPSGSAGQSDLHQSFERRPKTATDSKHLIQLRPHTQYLVRAFNFYEQGRLYQSHGSNDHAEMDLPSGGETLQLQVQNDRKTKNGYRRKM